MVKVVVIGCGVIGLTTALQIQKDIKDAHVTIMAEKLSPNTTGDVSAGLWTPYLLQDTPESDIFKWSKITHDKFHEFWKKGLASMTGICLQPTTKLSKESPLNELPTWITIPFGGHRISKERLDKINKQFNKNYTDGIHYVTFTCEPTKLLPYLLEDFFENGGTLILRKVENFEELKDYDLIVNCTGPGAKELTNDTEMHMIRGQVIRVQASWQFDIIQDDTEEGGCYIIPNTLEVILGGTHQMDDMNLSPDAADKQRIMSECLLMSPSLKASKEIRDCVGLRPGRSKIRLEAEKYLTRGNKILNVVHNYGHGGAGVTLCYGCAQDASALVQNILRHKYSARL